MRNRAPAGYASISKIEVRGLRFTQLLGGRMSNEDEKMKQIDALKPGVTDAVNAMFAMELAIRENELSIRDLMDGLALAIKGPRQGEDGHDMAIIALKMMSLALEQDKTRST